MSDLQPPRTSRKSITREERLEVLRLLETGNISAGEADALLDALDAADQAGARGGEPIGPAMRARNVRVRISDPVTGKASINLALPLGLIEAGLNVARRFAPDKVPTVETIRQSVTAGTTGTLVDVFDKNERIEVIIE
ncbi:MAG: hypothetical protein M3464_16065 [Chloroflexota bacterium]|nr:hypothetical protein [Chloroflexota bacterium]